MGSWGHGNIDNDSALDGLSDRSSKLLKAMMARALRKRSRESDDYDYTTLFVEFEIVFALDARGLLMSGALPTPEEVETLKWDFVKDWEPYYREMAYKQETVKLRRQVILRTFNRFKRLCARHQDSPRG